MVAKCRPMAGAREFGSIGQNRLRTGSLARCRACEPATGSGEIVKFQNESKELW